MVLRSRPGDGASFLAFWPGGSPSALAIKLDVAPGRDHPRSYRETILGYRWVSAFLGLGYRVWDRTSLVGQKTPGMKGVQGSSLATRVSVAQKIRLLGVNVIVVGVNLVKGPRKPARSNSQNVLGSDVTNGDPWSKETISFPRAISR